MISFRIPIWESSDKIRFSNSLSFEQAKEVLEKVDMECWYNYSSGDYHYITVPLGRGLEAVKLLKEKE